jgi:hypothetical protein
MLLASPAVLLPPLWPLWSLRLLSGLFCAFPSDSLVDWPVALPRTRMVKCLRPRAAGT